MELPLVPVIVIAFIVVGNFVQLIWDRDDWPLSNYSMYAHLVADRSANPFVPLRKEHDGEAGVLVLVLKMTDGTSIPLTTCYAHALLMPYERLRILRHLTTLYRRDADVTPTMKNLASWVYRRNEETGARKPIKSLALELYVWRELPQRPTRNHPPDQIIAISEVETKP